MVLNYVVGSGWDYKALSRDNLATGSAHVARRWDCYRWVDPWAYYGDFTGIIMGLWDKYWV